MQLQSIIAVVLAVSAAMPFATVSGFDICDNFQCPDLVAPVCADGTTFENECLFMVAQCTNDALTHITMGACDGDTSVATTEPPKADAEGCKKMQCAPVDSPVCGTDDVTYENACYFARAKCLELVTTTKDELEIAFPGECTGKDEMPTVQAAPVDVDDIVRQRV